MMHGSRRTARPWLAKTLFGLRTAISGFGSVEALRRSVRNPRPLNNAVPPLAIRRSDHVARPVKVLRADLNVLGITIWEPNYRLIALVSIVEGHLGSPQNASGIYFKGLKKPSDTVAFRAFVSRNSAQKPAWTVPQQTASATTITLSNVAY
jgi:hypothetical protein